MSYKNYILGYGKNAEDVTKHKNDFVTTEYSDVAKVERTPRCHAIHEIFGEDGEIACWSVTESKEEIRDSKPVHIGVAILQHSKLLFIK